MKIEMLESLGYSFLRHVQGCWIVQTNWKASTKGLSDESWQRLEAQFDEMRDRFGATVFKGTRNARQLIKQAEIDVIGMTTGSNGHVHVLDAASMKMGCSTRAMARTTPFRLSGGRCSEPSWFSMHLPGPRSATSGFFRPR